MKTAHEHLVHWLKDAYAMEKQALEMCERQSERIENYPELKTRIIKHTEETKGQIERLNKCFSLLDETPSQIKDAIGWTMGNMQALGGMIMPDEIVKGSMASYIFENMEIASYKVLIATAEAAKQPLIAELCRENLEEEEAMPEWLSQHLPDTITQFIQRDISDMRAQV